MVPFQRSGAARSSTPGWIRVVLGIDLPFTLCSYVAAAIERTRAEQQREGQLVD
ncbi:hypothetical protein M3667_14625 [Microbacterium sp. P26]|uniref:hypothetical protein n=1 Tax=Microbacterium TaxID=33882 RepID=UPI00203AB16B|nr:hypothetical protein [Microbacterium sp. P26]MCM3503104.1 hypothetical protein [Microbacterium sp. P26]